MGRIAFAFCLLLACAPSHAQALAESLVLVATPQLEHPVYGRTVLVVKSFGADQHLGFIVNRPTALTLGRMFPEHAPSRKISDPVFLGGPVDAGALFALVSALESPGAGSVQLMPGLHVAIDAAAVDGIIEHNPGNVRFVSGLVVWRPGELRREVEQGAWYVLDADPALPLREPEGLWEELVRRPRVVAHLAF